MIGLPSSGPARCPFSCPRASPTAPMPGHGRRVDRCVRRTSRAAGGLASRRRSASGGRGQHLPHGDRGPAGCAAAAAMRAAWRGRESFGCAWGFEDSGSAEESTGFGRGDALVTAAAAAARRSRRAAAPARRTAAPRAPVPRAPAPTRTLPELLVRVEVHRRRRRRPAQPGPRGLRRRRRRGRHGPRRGRPRLAPRVVVRGAHPRRPVAPLALTLGPRVLLDGAERRAGPLARGARRRHVDGRGAVLDVGADLSVSSLRRRAVRRGSYAPCATRPCKRAVSQN